MDSICCSDCLLELLEKKFLTLSAAVVNAFRALEARSSNPFDALCKPLANESLILDEVEVASGSMVEAELFG